MLNICMLLPVSRLGKKSGVTRYAKVTKKDHWGRDTDLASSLEAKTIHI